jgi:hypothetical protein
VYVVLLHQLPHPDRQIIIGSREEQTAGLAVNPVAQGDVRLQQIPTQQADQRIVAIGPILAGLHSHTGKLENDQNSADLLQQSISDFRRMVRPRRFCGNG